MRQRKLGADGPSVGAIGLGCMSFAGFYGPTDIAESHRTLAEALEMGMTHLDTARVYGNGLSEEVIGTFIRDHPGRFTIDLSHGYPRVRPGDDHQFTTFEELAQVYPPNFIKNRFWISNLSYILRCQPQRAGDLLLCPERCLGGGPDGRFLALNLRDSRMRFHGRMGNIMIQIRGFESLCGKIPLSCLSSFLHSIRGGLNGLDNSDM